MPTTPPPRRDPPPAAVRRLLRGLVGLGALFLTAFALARGNPNAGIFLFLAVVCLGLAIVSLFARGLQRLGGTLLDGRGKLERDLLMGGLLLIGLLTPWSVAVPTLHWPQTFGWQSPLALLVVGAVILNRIRPLGRYGVPAVLLAGLGLLAWAAWISVQLLSPAFRGSGFPFLPIDLLGEGWYVAVLAVAVSVDGMAAGASDDARPARPSDVWPFSIVPGTGLVRLHYPGRGRLWLAAAAFSVFLLQANAVGPEEFQYYAALRSLPEPRSRGAALVPVVLGLLIWLASLRDTQQKLRLERIADEPLARPVDRRDSTAL
jgi:hypothetical protein